MRIVIVDRSLIDRQGHHFDLQMAYSLAFKKFSRDILWAVNKSFQIPVEFPVKRIFSHSFYSDNPQGTNLADTLSEYRHLFSMAMQKGIDFIFVHTSVKDDFWALSKIAHRYPSIKILACTPYHPSYMPGQGASDMAYKAMLELHTLNNVRLLGETPELVDQYKSHSIRMTAMGIPIEISKVNPSSAYFDGKYGSMTLSYLGSARAEKRFDLFVKFARKLCADQRFHSILKEIIVCTFEPIKKPSKAVEDAISDIKELSNVDHRINLIATPLSKHEYLSALQRATLAWLGYEPICYASGRGSGILIDCLSNGCSIIASKGTAAQYYLTGNGFLLDDSLDECVERLYDFANNLNLAKKRAIYAREKIQQKYSSSAIAHNVFEMVSFPDR